MFRKILGKSIDIPAPARMFRDRVALALPLVTVDAGANDAATIPPIASTIMISIDHPRINGKPPLKKQTSDVPPGRMERDRKITDASASSIEQLCDMISDLENGMGGKIPGIEPTQGRGIDRVSSRPRRSADSGSLQVEPERDESQRREREPNGATYDDIMSFLTSLEDDSRIPAAKLDTPEAAILGEIFADADAFAPPIDFDLSSGNSRTLDDDLAAVRARLDERNASLALLREQLQSERRVACEKLTAQKRSNASKLQQLENKYKGIVARHQKFIEQLISEKTELTEKCNSLVERVKEIDARTRRDLKAAADRHAVELQKARERFAAAEKIKRERWIECRTAKIKEMTVKGLEPELRDLMQQHAEEVQRLRSSHAKELQDAELQAMRRSSVQLEQLRQELTASNERTLASERETLRTRYLEKLREQEELFEEKQAKLTGQMERRAAEFEEERARREAETDTELRKLRSRHQREVDALRQQHAKETETVHESLKTEWATWFADYKRQQNSRFEQAERRIKEECSRDRDRQIELAIERLEKDTRTMKLTLQRSFDHKLECMAEEFRANAQAARASEELHRGKATRAADELKKVEAQLQQAEKKLRENASESRDANEAIKRLTVERDEAKRSVRQEIEGEKRELEEKIASLYQEIARISANRDTSMAQLYSRIKLVLTQKLLAIKSLNKELADERSRRERLETLLDQQRREYIMDGAV